MERVACASGLLSAVLRFAFALLDEDQDESSGQPSQGSGPLLLPPSEGETEAAVDPALVAATEHLLECVEEEARVAKGKLAQVTRY